MLLVAVFSWRGNAATYFYDTFDAGATLPWTPTSGTWTACQPPGSVGYRYCQTTTNYLPPMSLAGDNRWADYYVQATVNMDNDVTGRVAILGRVQDNYHLPRRVDSPCDARRTRRDDESAWSVLVREEHERVLQVRTRDRLVSPAVLDPMKNWIDRH